MKQKNGQAMATMQGLLVALAASVIVMAVMFLIIAQVRTQAIALDTDYNASNASTWDTAVNATETLQAAAATVPNWFPLIIIAVIGAALIGLVAMFGRR